MPEPQRVSEKLLGVNWKFADHMAIHEQIQRIRNLKSTTWQTVSREDMWRGLLDRLSYNDQSFPEFLQHHAVNGEISLARRDVRNIYASHPTCGVVATIIWSHARGIRVNALSLLVRDLTKLVELFENDDFDENQMSQLLGQPGISIPTASKMLSACGRKYKGKPAAIIDDTIIQVIEAPEFASDFTEISELRGKSRSRPIPYYEAYLEDVASICGRYDVTADMVDRFLSEYALVDAQETDQRKSA